MSLVHKTVTAKMLAANRTNARKSTGPRSEEGIRNSSRNALQHGIFPKLSEASMRDMGENPEDYEKLREELYRTFQPEDGFEQMLVEGMAQLGWRGRRLIRAESGRAASQRRKLEIDRTLARYGRGSAHERLLKLHGFPKFGFAGMADSVEKCDRMLGLLHRIRAGVLEGGFSEQDMLLLFQTAYGESGAMGDVDLRPRYEMYRKAAQSGEPGDEAELRKSFVAGVDAEIAAYERLRELLTARDLEATDSMKDAELLPGGELLRAIAQYESGLDRQFDRKLRQLVAWRQAKRGVNSSDRSGAEAEKDKQRPKEEITHREKIT